MCLLFVVLVETYEQALEVGENVLEQLGVGVLQDLVDYYRRKRVGRLL